VSFAGDPGTHAYYHWRAGEYDEWYEGEGRFAARERPGWEDELGRVIATVAALPAARTLDIACGTAFLSRHLSGFVVGLDASPAMVAIAQERLPGGLAVLGDALDLPFADQAFDRVLCGHFYGHLAGEERTRFLAECRRVAPELVVVDTALRDGVAPEAWEERRLNDGSVHRVYKRYLAPDDLRNELGAEIVQAGTWFVMGVVNGIEKRRNAAKPTG
jgi:demethylmenaquinone methyltransferase/2-methoxy-6-polyprenyl-1,4-benzoquinol methylase